MTTSLDWQGKTGSVWAQEADTLDLLLGPVGQAGIEVLGDIAGQKVLDLACGAGQSSLDLASKGADVFGIDISADLLALAKERDRDGLVDYRLADAAQDALGGPYDAIYARCGTMFFDDPLAAFKHLGRHLKDGAKFAFVCWAEPSTNEWAQLPIEAAKPIFDIGAPQTGPGPFAWSDPAMFEKMLPSAGFQIENLAKKIAKSELRIGDNPDPVARAVDFAMRIGPLASRLKSQPDTIKARLRPLLYHCFSQYVDGDAVRVSNSAWIISGSFRNDTD